MNNKVILVFGMLGLGILVLAGLDLLVERHLPRIELVLGGAGLIALTIASSGLSDSD